MPGAADVIRRLFEAVDVMENINDIYAYLKARADGALDRGRPQRQAAPKP